MSGFQLDTSGTVEVQPMTEAEGSIRLRWSDLSPFAQGYVEALFAELIGWVWAQAVAKENDGVIPLCVKRPGFDRLAPDALQMIVADCERYLSRYGGDFTCTNERGRWLWMARQKGGMPMTFPPVQLSLSEDGKVNLIPQAQVGDA